ncbi:MAG: glycoside hydrolase family protein [Pseudomonadota bacterium]
MALIWGVAHGQPAEELPASLLPITADATTSDRGLAIAMDFEGLELTAYQDIVGIWTIGYGHTSLAGPPEVGPGLTITAQEAEEILRRDLKPYETFVHESVSVPLSQNMFDALVMLAYSIGTNGFRRSTMLKRLNNYDYEGAVEALQWWNKANGRVVSGLTRRREAEATLFLDGYERFLENPFVADQRSTDQTGRIRTEATARRSIGAVVAGRSEEVIRSSTFAGDRKALVVSVVDYEHIESLRRISADAQDVAAVLSDQFGFQVTTLTGDRSNTDGIRAGLGAFADDLSNRQAGVIYVLGVGFEMDGRNYLAAADFDPDSPASSAPFEGLIGFEEILEALVVDGEVEAAPPRAAIFNASFSTMFDRPIEGLLRQGLAPIVPPPHTLAVYAAQSEALALQAPVQGTARSNFAEALFQHWKEPRPLSESLAVGTYLSAGPRVSDDILFTEVPQHAFPDDPTE